MTASLFGAAGAALLLILLAILVAAVLVGAFGLLRSLHARQQKDLVVTKAEVDEVKHRSNIRAHQHRIELDGLLQNRALTTGNGDASEGESERVEIDGTKVRPAHWR